MHVAIIGGTGDLGEALAVRFALDTDHEITIGSRMASKARTVAEQYRTKVNSASDSRIVGADNTDAARDGDVVILSVPPYHVRSTLDTIQDELTTNRSILVTPGVGISGTSDGVQYDPPDVGSVTELVARLAPSEIPVVGAFHSLPANRLADPDESIDMDTLVVGDEQAPKERVANLVAEIDGLRPVDGGPLTNASTVESLTPLLINVAANNDLGEHPGLKII